jgi:hypothetical protein
MDAVIISKYGLNSFDSGRKTVAGSRGHGNESPAYINFGNFVST